MQAGDLRHRITVQRYTENEDENGIRTGEWQDFKTVWCSANGLFGNEYWEAKQYDAENTVEFQIRHNACPDLSPKDRLLFKGRLFNISSVDNVQYRNERLKIKAVEVVP